MYRHYGCAILLKGGHATGNADDLLYDGTDSLVPRLPHKLHEHTRYRMYIILCHCKCPCLCKTLPDAVYSAKEYVRGAMSTGLDLGARKRAS